MIFSCLCFASCSKDKNNDEDNGGSQKQEPTIVVDYDKTNLYVGTKLRDVNIFTKGDGTSGTIAWQNLDYELVLGDNTCNWIFTPTDSDSYNSKSGSVVLAAVKKLIEPNVTGVKLVEGQIIYYDIPLQNINLSQDFVAEYQGLKVEGEVVWKNPNELTRQGENEYEWKFIPTNSSEYSSAFGKIKFNAELKPVIESVSVYYEGSSGLSSCVAYDTFNFEDLKLNYNLSGGIVIPKTIKPDDCEIIGLVDKDDNDVSASERTDFRRGDKKVKAKYTYNGSEYNVKDDNITKTFEFEIELENPVGFMEIKIPDYDKEISYDGGSHSIRIENTSFYTCTPTTGVNAGIYKLTLTLIDSENCKWEGSEDNSSTIEIDCEILKADQVVSNNASSDLEYNGESHRAIVTANYAETVYYSQTQLDKNNYLTKGSDSIEFINANTYKVYFYAVGDSNHNDLAGEFNFEIKRQTPTINLEFCYTLKTNNPVVYPSDFVTIKNNKDETIAFENSHIGITYWEVYNAAEDSQNPNKKTQPASSGSESEGTAPVNHLNNGYVVKVDYTGDSNYMPVSGTTTLYIENDNLGLFAADGESDFAFKENAENDVITRGIYSIISTSSECENYIKFEKMPVDKYGLIGVGFVSKFVANVESEESEKYSYNSGKLIYNNGDYQIQGSDGILGVVVIGNNQIDVQLSYKDVHLSKWVIPSYASMSFSAKTLDEDKFTESDNESCYSIISFENDYGTIKFNAVFESERMEIGEDNVIEGHSEYSGLAVAEFDGLDGFDDFQVCIKCYTNGGTHFIVSWSVRYLENPQKITLINASTYLFDTYIGLELTRVSN